MNKCMGFVLVAVVCLTAVSASTIGQPPAKPQSLNDLMAIIEQMQQQIDELHAKVAALEDALATGKSPPSAQAPSGSLVIVITEIEDTPPDPDMLDEIATLEADAREEDATALSAQKEAERYLSSVGKSRSDWARDDDATNDAKRKAALERADDHRKKARDLRGQAARLQRKVDERGPLIRGWNGNRRVALELTKALPASARTLVPGDFISWKGTIKKSDSTLEIWTASTVERTQRPAGFKDDRTASTP